jgi:hypothetical protein
MTATVEFSDDARRMLDDADEQWVAEHGYLAANQHGLFADNSLFEQNSHARTLLADIPQLGKIARRGRTTSTVACTRPSASRRDGRARRRHRNRLALPRNSGTNGSLITSAGDPGCAPRRASACP